MKLQDIVSIRVDDSRLQNGVTPLLEGEIAGASVFYHVISGGQTIQAPTKGLTARIFFLCGGSAEFAAGGKAFSYGEKAVFVPDLNQAAKITAVGDAQVLEINWKITGQEAKAMDDAGFPFAGRYLDALQYRDPFKSEKTISRAVIPQRMIPRFAMGSVETYGGDLIGQHSHPLLDQFFFSFPENDMELLIDDLALNMKGNTLLHIPLGSNHGVRLTGDRCAHYLWIDFILYSEEGLAYLDATHIATGTHKSF